MSKKLLVTRPEHDLTTTYLSGYAKSVIKFAEDKGIGVKDFSSGNVKREVVEKFIKKQNPVLLFFNGHGEIDSIEGDKGDILILEDENDYLLKGKITYARSCFVAESLGKKFEKDKDSCFIGYSMPFQFWVDETRSSNPLKDKTAALYLIPSNELVNSLIKGNKAKVAFDNSKRLMVKNMNKIQNENEPGALEKLKSLWINYEGQEIHGNGELVL